MESCWRRPANAARCRCWPWSKNRFDTAPRNTHTFLELGIIGRNKRMPSPTPVVLVTGSSRGLGRGVAETLAQAGFSVAIHYAHNKEAADATAQACRELAPH